jgi:hypothetical protein
MIKRVLRLATGGALALVLAACAVDPYAPSVCTESGPNSPGWPYCGTAAEPGGPSPTEDRIDPTGREPR